MTDDEIKQDIMNKLTVPVWPHVGRVLGLSKNPTYEAAKRQDFDCIRVGRALRAPTAPLRRRLGIEPANAA
jgi:hypothetical protein